VSQGLTAGQPEGARRFRLSPVERLKAGPEDLRDVRRVADAEGGGRVEVGAGDEEPFDEAAACVIDVQDQHEERYAADDLDVQGRGDAEEPDRADACKADDEPEHQADGQR
jgi:hypothetical protein